MADEDSGMVSVQKVCEFLRKRGVEEEVIDRFSSEKMDASAISVASDDQLKELGLNSIGDRLSLRGRCASSTNQHKLETSDRKRKLLETFLNQKKPKHKSKSKINAHSSTASDVKEKVKCVQLGWLHWDQVKNNFLAVRLPKGGGTRDVSLPVTATQEVIMEQCLQLFFPDGVSHFFGPASDLNFGLANFNQVEIRDTLKHGESEVPFTISNYQNVYKTNKVRLYLTSRNVNTEKKDSTEDNNKQNDDQCDDYLPSYTDMFDLDFDQDAELYKVESKDSISVNLVEIDDDSQSDFPSMLDMATNENPTNQSHTLIGSSNDRQVLLQDQNKSYEESLQIDRAKEAQIEREVHKAETKEALRLARASRVDKEPDTNEKCCEVQVRHPFLGLLRRRFLSSALLSSVYDWIGSQSPDPAQFQFFLPEGKIVEPNIPISFVNKCTLNMKETEHTPSLDGGSPIQFRGFGEVHDDSIDTAAYSPSAQVNDHSDEELLQGLINEHPMEEQSQVNVSDVSMSQEISTAEAISHSIAESENDDENAIQITSQVPPHERGRYFRQVMLPQILQKREKEMPSFEQRRKKLLEDLGGEGAPPKLLWVERWNVLQTLLEMYRADDALVECVLQFRFKDEMGCDYGGLSREVYSLFWKECSMQFFEGNDNSFVPRHSGISKEEYITLGKIMHHAFLLTGIFPVSLNQAYTQAMLLGEDEVPEEILLRCYLQYLGPYEGSRLEEVLNSPTLEKEDKEFMIELEDRCGMRISPDTTTVRKIAIQIARSELLQLPMHTMARVKQGMTMNIQGKQLWQNISKQDIDAIYCVQSPCPSKVTSLLVSQREDLSKEESKVFGYLKRYLASTDQKKCEAFLRYCTASNTIVVDKISVNFFKSVAMEPLPRAHTCGAVLEMPSSGYPTYNFFKVLMDSLLENQLAYQFKFE